MRILFFNYEYPPLGGGAANATEFILREYSKMPGLEVDLVTSSVDEKYHLDKCKVYFIFPKKSSLFDIAEYSKLITKYWYNSNFQIITEEDFNKVKELRDAGKTWQEIGESMGTTGKNIQRLYSLSIRN